MSTWLTNLAKPYCGGPNYDKPRTKIYQLENWELSVCFPGGRDLGIAQPQPVNFAFRDPKSKFGGIHIGMESWIFGAPLRTRLVQAMSGMFEPLGEASVVIDVRKLEEGKVLDWSTPTALGEYIKWEYHNHLETPPVEGRNNGSNYIIRQREGQLLASKGERYRRNHDTALESQLMPHPQQMEHREIQGLLWTYYIVRRYGYTPCSFYAIPLDNEYYLLLEFRGRLEVSGESHRAVLTADMQQIEQWMMPRLRLTEVNPALKAPAPVQYLPPSDA